MNTIMNKPITPEERARALQVDLAEFLLKHHPAEVHVKRDSVLLNADHHVSVKRGTSCYNNFRVSNDSKIRDKRVSGNNIDYLITWLGYDYRSAVLSLLEEGDCYYTSDCFDGTEAAVAPASVEYKKASFPLEAPVPWNDLNHYLHGTRKIPADVIADLRAKGLIYQDIRHNVVFTNSERTYCEIRGTNAVADKRCKRRMDCPGYCSGKYTWCKNMNHCKDYKPDSFHSSRKAQTDEYWYYVPDDKYIPEVIFVCEAAIDAISLYSIHKAMGIAGKAKYVSIGGVGNQKTINRLKELAKENVNQKVVLAVDNDSAGEECRTRNYELDYILPMNKDWNEDLIKDAYGYVA